MFKHLSYLTFLLILSTTSAQAECALSKEVNDLKANFNSVITDLSAPQGGADLNKQLNSYLNEIVSKSLDSAILKECSATERELISYDLQEAGKFLANF